ncbi:ASST-domain-containing protein [Aspergillus aurantiobrunneus]
MRHSFLLATTALLNVAHASRDNAIEPTGPWPTEIYRSSSALGTAVYFARSSPVCQDGLYTLLAPRGEGVAARGPTILDQHGEIVWASEAEYGAAYNLDVQEYKGESYLTFWEGYDNVDGHGEGTIHMLDSQYIERYTLHGPNGHSADLHEFQITRDDTALFTVYDIVSADLRSVRGPQMGWIWDSRFVEIDIETNNVLFEWRASEHFNFTDVTVDNPDSAGWTYGHPWDFFHLHSVDKDAKGNYLISALHTDHLTYLDGRTGKVIWRLGGNRSDFEDRSLGKRASTFAWPQDARFRDNDKAITLFDNTTPGDKVNRGVFIDVDQTEMTLDLREEYRAYGHAGVTPEAQPQSDGSVQVLSNGNVVVSYGRNGAAWTQFSKMGVPQCHTQFGSRSRFGTGIPASYRVRKRPWIGQPDTTPAFEINGYLVAVSWNGATEVARWVLEGAEVPLPDSNHDHHDINADPNKATSDIYFSAITTVNKKGFETIISIPWSPLKKEYPYLRVRALDHKNLIIGTSAILPFHRTAADPQRPPRPPSQTKTHHSPALFFAGVGATLGLLVCIFLFRRYCWATCLRSCRQLQLRRYQHLRPHRRGSESNWEEYYATEEQEVGLHTVSETETDDSDEVEVSVLDNPRLSPAVDRASSQQSTLGSADSGRPMLIRTPSPHSTASAREKQH